jgi:YD repeat-containing protein
VTVLYFDEQGQVVEHRDYDNHIERREPPYSGW